MFVRRVAEEVQAVPLCEVGIRLVQNEGGRSERLRESDDHPRIDDGTRRGVWVGQEHQVRALRPRPHESPRFDKPLRFEAGALNLREALVEDVTRRRGGDQPAFGHERTREDGQDVVGAIPNEDAVRINPQHAARGFAKRIPQRLWVLPQAVRCERGADRLEHPRAGRVGVLVGVELEDVRVVELLAGRVARHCPDVRSDAV